MSRTILPVILFLRAVGIGLNISPNAIGRLEIEVGSELCCATQRCMTLHMLISMNSAVKCQGEDFLGPESDTGWELLLFLIQANLHSIH